MIFSFTDLFQQKRLPSSVPTLQEMQIEYELLNIII